MKVLFRAEVKKIGALSNCQVKPLTEINGKFYAIGFESILDDEFGITDLNGYYYECKQETRSINFSNMLDSKGNKIFASLQEDGAGGDYFIEDGDKKVIKFYNLSVRVFYENNLLSIYSESLEEWFNSINRYDFKVIGVQK